MKYEILQMGTKMERILKTHDPKYWNYNLDCP